MENLLIVGGNVLLADGSIAPRNVFIQNGLIAGIYEVEITPRFEHVHTIDAHGKTVLPGIIDIHGDAFERQLMPRPGVHFPIELAFKETDQQLITNGITTAFHGVTYSWEPGLRGKENFLNIAKALKDLKSHLAADNRLHLRFETYNLDALDIIEEHILDGDVALLAYNDHIDHIYKDKDSSQKMSAYANRTDLSEAAFKELLERVSAREDQVPEGIKRLAAAARKVGIPQLSHDDETPATRQFYFELGSQICEFPVNKITIQKALEYNNHIVLGAPNVVRGGSHTGAIHAGDAVLAGQCTILASDYYYPSQFAAVIRLMREDRLKISEAWRLISQNPAEAAGLTDRGQIDIGKRADIVVTNFEAALPKIMTTIVNGHIAYASHTAMRKHRFSDDHDFNFEKAPANQSSKPAI